MNARLVAEHADSSGEEHLLFGEVTTLGREQSNDIVVQSRGVSRYHARITRTGSTFAVEDLGSSNGTWLNDKRIEGKAMLRDGDHVRFDDQAFAFRDEEAGSQTLARGSGSPHETVTVMFADLVGHTALFESLGSDTMYRVLERHIGIMKSEVVRHSGRVVKTEGDGILASFSSIREAVDAAIEIQRAVDAPRPDGGQRVPVRVGIHSGEALKQGEDLIGIAVIKAARVMAEAGAGEIYLSEISRGLLGSSTGHRIVSRGWHQLKGISRRERLSEVVWR